MAQQQIISEQDKAELKRTFRKDLKAIVNLRLFTQEPSPLTIPGRECSTCLQTQQLMEELSGLSPKLRLETIDFYHQAEAAKGFGVARIPAIVLDADGSNRVKFYGIPAGYELAAMVEDIKTISRGVSPLNMETRKQLRRVNQPVHIQVFVTPSDTNCPGGSEAGPRHCVGMSSCNRGRSGGAGVSILGPKLRGAVRPPYRHQRVHQDFWSHTRASNAGTRAGRGSGAGPDAGSQ